jgi:hypothetical protein
LRPGDRLRREPDKRRKNQSLQLTYFLNHSTTRFMKSS